MPTLYIKELYLSIQGEARYSGYPCVFVRLSGCPMRCRWCDTAYGFEGGEHRSFDDLLQDISTMDCKYVELTGGEPLAQKDSCHFMRCLVEQGYRVMLETGGGESIEDVPKEVHIIMDLKCPGSGMMDKNIFDNLNYIKPTDEIKFVIANRQDFEWALQQIQKYEIKNPLMSCAFALLPPATLAEWILKEDRSIKLNMQLHKYIWNPKAKGV